MKEAHPDVIAEMNRQHKEIHLLKNSFSQFYERAYFGHILQKSVDYYYRNHASLFQLKSLSVRIILNIRKLGI